MRAKWIIAAAIAAAVGLVPRAEAITRVVGDVDGFGFPSTVGLVRATPAPHTTPADTDGDGLIEPGEYLPDLNMNGNVQVGGGDDFDNRSAGEAAATDGAQWTDRSLTPAGASNGAQFTFTFAVPVLGDIDYGVDHFINLVFGDYDVVPAQILVDGSVVPLATQGAGQDGLVQAAHATVPWSALTDGQLVITIVAPNEPYLAFDYVLLSTTQFADRDQDGTPDPLDNCPDTPNQDQLDSDGDGLGDACDACPLDPANDADGDGICGNVDLCPGTTVPEAVPTVSLGVNRFALVDGDALFDTRPPQGVGPRRSYSLSDTAGCACGQIVDALGLGNGERKFGCSIGVMDRWVKSVR